MRKKVAGGSFTLVRMECSIGTVDWSALFPIAPVDNRTTSTSDHGQIELILDPTVSRCDRAPRLPA